MRGAVRIYESSLNGLAAGESVSVLAKPTGWRFFVPGLSNDHAADVIRGRRGYAMTRWSEGPDNRRCLATVERLVSRPEVRGPTFELRLLEIPGLHLLSLWLHDAGIRELFVPVSHLPLSIASGRILSLAEFDRALQEHARSVVSSALENRDTGTASAG
jgi:hypothetical protein